MIDAAEECNGQYPWDEFAAHDEYGNELLHVLDAEARLREAATAMRDTLAEKNRHKQSNDSSRTPPREAGQGCEAPEGGGIPPRKSASPAKEKVPTIPHVHD